MPVENQSPHGVAKYLSPPPIDALCFSANYPFVLSHRQKHQRYQLFPTTIFRQQVVSNCQYPPAQAVCDALRYTPKQHIALRGIRHSKAQTQNPN